MRVAVIGGGTSPEAEVSRRSANEVVDSLSSSHDVRYIEFDNELNNSILELNPHVAFPVLHGVPGEDGAIQGYLESINLPFVGSQLTASALAINKFVAKSHWKQAGLPVLPMCLLDQRTYTADKTSKVKESLGESLVVKPCRQGSALGVHLLPIGGDLDAAIEDAFTFDQHLLVEPFKTGRELTVGVLELDGHDTTALPVIEIQVLKEGEWYDFNNRYEVNASRHVIEPALPEGVTESLKRFAVTAHQTLGCRDLSRSDFIVEEDGTIWLLEINTIPGMTKTSLYPDAIRAADIEIPELMRQFVEKAANRNGNSRNRL